MQRVDVEHAAGGSEVMVVTEVSAPADGAAGPARCDALTGLPGEAELRARLSQSLDRAGCASLPVALLAIECASAKSWRDDLGAEGGARLLSETARRLRGHAGPADFLAQTGDARFALVLGDLDEPGTAERVAGAIVHDLSQPVVLHGSEARPAASVGVALFPEHGGRAAELLARAETALREASHLGGDAYLVAR